MKVYLIVAKGKHQGTSIEIKVDLFMIGSDKMCQLRSKLPGIQPRHCAIITREDRKVFIQDMGEGTTELNGELLPPGEDWPLHVGDRLVVGPLEFMIQFREKALSQRDAEEWALKSLDQEAQKDTEEEEESAAGSRPARPEDASSAASAILGQLQAQRGVVKGRLRIADQDGITHLRFNDTYLVDKAELTLIKKELFANINRPNMRVLLDFKNVQRMSTAATELIKDLVIHLRAKGSTLALCRLRPDLHLMLETLDMLKNIPVFPDRTAAQGERW